MKRILHKIQLTFITLVAFGISTFATNYYASPSGSGNGLTAATPTSITNAINTKATVAGDSVILAAGTYYPSAQLISKAAIIIKGAGSASTIINGNAAYTTSAWADVSILKILHNCNVSNLSIKNSYQGIYGSYGGGIYIKGVSALTVTLNDVDVSACQAEYGSGIYAENTTLTVNNSYIHNNIFDGGGNGNGGGLYLKNCSSTISNTTVSGNQCEMGSGINAINGTLTINSSTIENNGKDPGTDSSFEGGGIYIFKANTTINDSKIRGNYSYSGAGVYASGSGSETLVINRTNIYQNSTAPTSSDQGYGGGIYSSSYLTTANYCSLSDNTAGLGGGSVYICGGTTSLNHCTVSYNDKTVVWAAGTAGIQLGFFCSSTFNLSGSIISGNSNTQALWSALDPNISSSISSSQVNVSNSIVGNDVYGSTENVTSSAFNPSTDLAAIDANGNVLVTNPTYSAYGAASGLPTPSFTTSPGSSSCSGYDVTYTTQSGQNNYTWTIPGTLNTDYSITSGGVGTSNYTVTLKWLTAGSKTVTVNYKNGVGFSGASAASSSTNVFSTPTISNSVSGSSCGAGSVALAATPSSGSVKWYIADGTNVHTGTNYNPTVTLTTIYYVDATNNGCTTPTRTAVTATVVATPSINNKTINICSGDLFTFTPVDVTNGTVPSGTTYYWSSPSSANIIGQTSGTGATSIGNTLTNLTNSLQSISYTVTPASGTCYGSAFTVTVNVNPTPTVSVSNGNICGSGAFTFTPSSDISGTTYNWYTDASGGSSIWASANYTTPTLSTTTNYYIAGTYNGCTNASRTTATAYVTPSNTSWTGGTSTDWNNATNWSNGIPGACSVVDIKQGSYYPNISAFASNVVCRKIIFEPGTSIYGLDKLTYDSAVVNIDLKRDKWYMLTAPLKEMYSGDYYFEGAPVTQMKLFGANYSASAGTNIQTITGNWTNSFASLTEKLNPGEGFAYKMEQTEWHYPTGYSALTTDKTVTFPRTNTDGSLKKTAIPYNGITGKPYPSLAQSMTKDDTKAYRFAMENTSNTLTSISIPVKAGLNLIGNPLMSHLDFTSLYNDNSSLISNYVQFWNGSSFGSITTSGVISGSTVEGLGLKIPPMKSFVINALHDGNLVINLTNFTPNGTVSLKSASTPENTMYIESDNGLARSSSSIVMNPNATNSNDKSDVSKLCSQITTVPEVYTISGKNALDINQFNSYPYIVPVGVKAGGADSVKLNFKGVESFEGVEVRLINTATNEAQDLKENCKYCFKADDSNAEGTLFLEFRSASTTTATSLANSNSGIQIFAAKDNNVKVVSTSDNHALEIFVYDPLGKLVNHKSTVSNISESISINHPGKVFIVKVISEKGVETKKVILE